MTTYEEFRAELEASDRRTRRKELVVRVATLGLLFAFGLPGAPWSRERAGHTLALLMGTLVSQVLLHMGLLERCAARWIDESHPRLRAVVMLLLLVAIVLAAVCAYELGCYLLER